MANKKDVIFDFKINGLEDIEKFKSILKELRETTGRDLDLSFEEALPYFKELERLFNELKTIYPEINAQAKHLDLILGTTKKHLIEKKEYPHNALVKGTDAILSEIKLSEQGTITIENFDEKLKSLNDTFHSLEMSDDSKLKDITKEFVKLMALLQDGDNLGIGGETYKRIIAITFAISDVIKEKEKLGDTTTVEKLSSALGTLLEITAKSALNYLDPITGPLDATMNIIIGIKKALDDTAKYESPINGMLFKTLKEYDEYHNDLYKKTKDFLDKQENLNEEEKKQALTSALKMIEIRKQFYIKDQALKLKYGLDGSYSSTENIGRAFAGENPWLNNVKYLEERNQMEANYGRGLDRNRLIIEQINEKIKAGTDLKNLYEKRNPQITLPNPEIAYPQDAIKDQRPKVNPIPSQTQSTQAKPFVSSGASASNFVASGNSEKPTYFASLTDVGGDSNLGNISELLDIDEETLNSFLETFQNIVNESQIVSEGFSDSFMAQTEERKEAAKEETEVLDEQKEERINILSQLGEAYTNNTAGVKDAFSTILDTFKGSDPIVNGLLGITEKALPKLLGLFQKTNKDINKDVDDSTQARNDAFGEGMKKTEEIAKSSLDKIEEHVQQVTEGIGMIFSAINESLDKRIEEAKERYEALSEKYDEVAEKVKESNDRIKSLHEEAKNAQGGRLVIIQEQISREMEANKELADQEQQLAKDKEKAEAEKEKLEKKQKKNELKGQIIQAIANIALGITKALSLGPILGPIMAAIVGAAGAIQIAQLNKQMSKLADGGLLNGKTHAQGGMRIEGTNIEVEGGEYVINRVSTRRNAGLLHYINSQRRQLTPNDIDGYFNNAGGYNQSPNFRTMFADGGQLPVDSAMNTYDNDRMIRAVESINMQPVVSVVDIANVQQNLTKVTDWTNTQSF